MGSAPHLPLLLILGAGEAAEVASTEGSRKESVGEGALGTGARLSSARDRGFLEHEATHGCLEQLRPCSPLPKAK